jgi:hypothetical protein
MWEHPKRMEDIRVIKKVTGWNHNGLVPKNAKRLDG